MKKVMSYYLLFASFIIVSNVAKGAKVKDIDGNIYHTVTIGDQTWLVENLKTTKYRNADVIPNVTDSVAWGTLTTGAQCSYNNEETNVKKYGRLYNWYAVNDKRIIAPEGWHVASLGEWQILENYLIANGYNYDEKNIGKNYAKSIASSTDWAEFNREGTIGNDLSKNNYTGFNALPGGWRMKKGFEKLNIFGTWWTSTSVYSICLISESQCFYSIPWSKPYGYSIRCIKDNKPTLITSSVVISTNSTATSGGKIYADGGCKITSRGVCWNTTSKPTIKLETKTVETSKLDSSDLFTSSITGLTNNKTYFVRAYTTYTYGSITDVVYGNEQRFTFNSETLPITDIDGNIYHTVKIGKQIWMVENLKTTKYRDGSTIMNEKDDLTWCKLKIGAQCAYKNYAYNSSKYGLLYNWYAVNDPRKIAPAGWHVATDEEWAKLTEYLGGETLAGGYLKEANTLNWESPNINATNESGFNALPSGFRNKEGICVGKGVFGLWWSSTQNSVLPFAWSMTIITNYGFIGRISNHISLGYSVRCVKD
jgi:uncharacterized protein (TIGR02145 family)